MKHNRGRQGGSWEGAGAAWNSAERGRKERENLLAL